MKALASDLRPRSYVCMYMKNAGGAGKGIGVQLVCYDRRERE